MQNPKIVIRKRGGRRPSLRSFLTKGGKKAVKLNKTARRNIARAKKEMPDYKATVEPIIVDIGAGPNFARVTKDYVPTLLAGRCASRAYYWLQAKSSSAFS